MQVVRAVAVAMAISMRHSPSWFHCDPHYCDNNRNSFVMLVPMVAGQRREGFTVRPASDSNPGHVSIS
jgi:hypothetical protein